MSESPERSPERAEDSPEPDATTAASPLGSTAPGAGNGGSDTVNDAPSRASSNAGDSPRREDVDDEEPDVRDDAHVAEAAKASGEAGGSPASPANNPSAPNGTKASSGEGAESTGPGDQGSSATAAVSKRAGPFAVYLDNLAAGATQEDLDAGITALELKTAPSSARVLQSTAEGTALLPLALVRFDTNAARSEFLAKGAQLRVKDKNPHSVPVKNEPSFVLLVNLNVRDIKPEELAELLKAHGVTPESPASGRGRPMLPIPNLDDAERLICALHGTKFMDRELRVELAFSKCRELVEGFAGGPARRTGDPEGPTLFLRGFPASFTEQDLRARFSAFGTITRISFGVPNATRHRQPYGWLEFSSTDEARKAMNTPEAWVVAGAAVVVEYARRRDAGAESRGRGRTPPLRRRRSSPPRRARRRNSPPMMDRRRGQSPVRRRSPLRRGGGGGRSRSPPRRGPPTNNGPSGGRRGSSPGPVSRNRGDMRDSRGPPPSGRRSPPPRDRRGGSPPPRDRRGGGGFDNRDGFSTGRRDSSYNDSRGGGGASRRRSDDPSVVPTDSEELVRKYDAWAKKYEKYIDEHYRKRYERKLEERSSAGDRRHASPPPATSSRGGGGGYDSRDRSRGAPPQQRARSRSPRFRGGDRDERGPRDGGRGRY